MPEPLIALLMGVTLVSLIASLGWAAWEHWGRRSRQVKGTVAYCVWCLYRRSDTCTHPGSPVYPDACHPVCDGDLQCDVRQQRQRW